MIANLIAAVLPFLPVPPVNSITPDVLAPVTAPDETEAAPLMLYVWAHRRCDLFTAVSWARANGYVPTSDPIFLAYVPEACGAAWVVYVRPVW